MVQQLAHRVWPSAYGTLLSPVQLENLLSTIYALPALQQTMQDGHRFWLFEQAGEAAGFASAYREAETMWLRKLYVLPELQGRGVGRLLLDTAMAHFAPVSDIRLNVNAQNLPAIAAYERWGFGVIDRPIVRMGDYDFEDLIMRKPCK